MAKNFLVDLNLNQNEVQNGVIQNLPSDPSNPIKGQVYFNTTTNKFRCYNGTTWDEMGTGGGTVTSVAIGNATNGGLSVSGSPITGAGTINIGHSNVLANAQTTSGIYPIKIDKNGHISEYGTAFDPSTKQNTISDLQTIREGAAAGATAVQPDDLNSYAPLASPALTGTPTAPTANAGTNTTQIATTAFVTNAISGITGAMVFKGTIGTGGTAGTALPTSNVKVGDTYKIITAGTYAGQAAKVGDLFIASATTPTWAYVPSGDDTDVTQVTAGAGLNTTGPDSSTDGGSITTSGTLNLTKTAVTPGTYQGITVDKYGRITGASDQTYLKQKVIHMSEIMNITSASDTLYQDIFVNDVNNFFIILDAETPYWLVSKYYYRNNMDAYLYITNGIMSSKVTFHAGQTPFVTRTNYDLQEAITSTNKLDYSLIDNAPAPVTESTVSGWGFTKLKKYAADITGNASTTSFTITHNLGSRDVTVQVYDGTTYEEVMVDITRTTTSAVVIAFAQAPASGKKYRVVCIG